MAIVTLHRAGAILDAIELAIKANEPKLTADVSVFSGDVAGEIAAGRAETIRAFEMTAHLLLVRAELRAKREIANAGCEVTKLIALRNAEVDLIKLLERVPGLAAAKPKPTEEELIYGRRRRVTPPAPVLDAASAEALVAAARTRYSTAENADAQIKVGTLTPDVVEGYAGSLFVAKRRLAEIKEQLSVVNANTHVEFDDKHLDWLADKRVA